VAKLNFFDITMTQLKIFGITTTKLNILLVLCGCSF
jgi:hypothetical protein